MGVDPSSTDDLDRMLSGSWSDDEWHDVARFVRDLHEAVPSSGLPSEDLHVAAMVETTHLLAEKGDPAVRPVSNAAGPAPQASGLPKQRRTQMKRKTSIVAKVLAPIAAVLTVFGGMAYAGALPRSVQNAVSHAAGNVGVTLPGDEDTQELPGENDDSQGDNDNQGEDQSKDEAVTPGDTGDDQGESSDDQGESSDGSESGDSQGENDDSQGENDNQGEDSQGDGTDQTSADDQGDTTESGGDQGDQGEDSQSGDTTGGDTSGGGDQQGDTQNSQD